MENIIKIKKLYQLKNIDRANSVKNRKESSAEHSWSCLILADYFLSRIKQKLDRIKVYELLMYHDVVEIESDDSPLNPEKERIGQHEKETIAMEKLSRELPDREFGKKINDFFHEFEENKTPEAKFANAIDKLDAVIHDIDYKKDWKGWSEAFLRKEKEWFFVEFPAIKEAFDRIMAEMTKQGYFSQ